MGDAHSEKLSGACGAMIGKPSDDAGCFSFDMAFRISLVPASGRLGDSRQLS
jgi:hypothetical protein